jgi:MinD-like ATPase involved in chromosome partitioning or flagellar assembly
MAGRRKPSLGRGKPEAPIVIRYDEALPKFAALVRDALGAKEMFDQVFLRDAAGRLTYVIRGLLPEGAEDAIRAGTPALAPWVDPDTPLATPEDLFDPDLGAEEPGFPEFVNSELGYLRLVERRLVGQDWLRPPQEPVPGLPPIVVFASHKGGVGRSTALAVSAAALSKAAYNILVVDLDLEAPGLGAMLLADLPDYGTLDYFVETGLGDVNDAFMSDMVAASALAEGGQVHVAPAVGAKSNADPQNVLGKIARAYVERVDEDGSTISFLDRTRDLVTRLCAANRYDAVFIDARAGLNEATAAAVLGLGAEILLFGVDTPQTFAGYRYFLAHLQRFRPEASDENDWRYRLRMVQARAQANASSETTFRTHAFEMFSDTVYDEEEGIEEEAFNFDYDDASAPHFAWPIADDPNYAEFDPFARGEQLAEHLFDRTFGGFIKNLREKIGLIA